MNELFANKSCWEGRIRATIDMAAQQIRVRNGD
jgi:hypothetical protein